jgi:arginase family enzyme
MNPIELAIAVSRIASNEKVQGMEVMEVSPPLDVGKGLTSITAGTMVMHMLGGLAKRKAPPSPW